MATIQQAKSLKKRVRKSCTCARIIADRAGRANRLLTNSIAEAAIKSAAAALDTASVAFYEAIVTYRSTL